MIEVDREEYKNLTIRYMADSDCTSPRENDNLGTIVYWHRRACYGDVDGAKQYDTPADFIDHMKRTDPKALILPVFLYDHSSVTLRATDGSNPFSCPWDSGQVGFVYVSREKLVSEYGKRITAKRRANAVACLKSEVDEFSQWCNGECYGYIIENADGKELDSCWGHIGYDCVREAAREAADGVAEEEAARKAREMEEERPDLYKVTP